MRKSNYCFNCFGVFVKHHRVSRLFSVKVGEVNENQIRCNTTLNTVEWFYILCIALLNKKYILRKHNNLLLTCLEEEGYGSIQTLDYCKLYS